METFKPPKAAHEWLDFLGRDVILLIIAGAVCGFVLFIAEFAFSYCLQLLFFALDLLPKDSVSLPNRLLSFNLPFYLGLFIIVAVLRALLQWYAYVLQGSATERFKARARTKLIEHIFTDDAVNSGSISALLGERANLAGSAISYLLSTFVLSATCSCLSIALFMSAPVITACSILILALAGIFLRSFNKRVAEAGRGINHEWNGINARVMMGVKNLLFLKINGTRAVERELAQAGLNRYLAHVLSYYKVSGFISTAPQVIGIFIVCSIAYISRAQGSLLVGGSLLAYLYLMFRFLQNLSAAAQNYSNFCFYRTQLNEIYKWHVARTARADVLAERLLECAPNSEPHCGAAVEWSLSKVSYGYPGANKSLFSDLDLVVPKGTLVTILGPSGSGKTTLLYLLIGELMPTSGCVRWEQGGIWFEGAEASKLLKPTLGFVGPESFLIEGSIRENLAYGNSVRLSDEEIKDALRAAECGFVWDFSNGLEHKLTEQGLGLSAGQKQRLCLARALLRRPGALLLDEATANLDEETERQLLVTLQKLKGSVTIVAVTHRHSFKDISDQQVLFDGAKVEIRGC